MNAAKVKKRLREFINPEKAAFFPRFFKTGKGQYGEGDRFLGVTVPHQRKVSKEFKELELEQILKLLNDPIHECRLTALLILVLQFEKAADSSTRKRLYEFYLKNLDRVNNWDLVDSSAHKIVGAYLADRPRQKLYQLANSDHLWSQRVAIVATYWFIKSDDFGETLSIAEILLDHEHDLIHKAVGWMLRELGKRDEQLLIQFLSHHYQRMPRTMLRYSIEKFDKKTRQLYLDGRI